MNSAVIPAVFAEATRPRRVALIRGLCQGDFFARYLSGAESMAGDLGIELVVYDGSGPRVSLNFESALRAGVDAIAVSSSDFGALRPAIDEALSRSIPVVGFDMTGEDPRVPTLEQDDLLIGFMLGRALTADRDGRANVIALNAGDYAPQIKRDRAWELFKWRYPEVREVARAGAVTDQVAADTEAVVAELLGQHPEVDVVVAFWDELARGAVRAIAKAGLAGKVRVYSVDVSDEDIEMMTAPDSPWVVTVATDARNIGRVAVRAAAALLAGERVGRNLLVEPQLITQELLRSNKIRTVEELVAALPTLGESKLAWFDWMEQLLARYGRTKPIATLPPDRLITESTALRDANLALESEIAERQRIEDELRFANLVLRTQQETSPDGILVVDARGKVLSFNRRFAEMWELPGELAETRSDQQIQSALAARAAAPEGFLAGVRAAYAGVQEVADEVTLADGRIFERHSAPMSGPDGEYRGRVWHYRDISARKMAEEGLKEADRRKDEFLAVLSHELRNPLAPIRTSLYVLERADPGSESAKRAMTVIERQVTQLARLVDDLLDVTRITKGRLQVRRERIDLRELVQSAADDHRPIFIANGVRLDTRLPSQPIWVLADSVRMSQVVGNLLSNAVKFTPRGGWVQLSLELEEQGAVLRVRDNGIGVDAEVLGRLFRPFSQALQTLERTRGGLGLGLALVKGLVELHEGTVEATSGGLGQGAEFTVRLPVEQGSAQPSVAPPREGHRPRRVLVIEDRADAADSLKEALVLMGHDVRVAYDGRTGIVEAYAFHPDVVLCDIGLPGIDGYEVARRFRADPELQGAVLIALTGYASADDRRRAAEAGFSRHIAKPPRIQELEQIVAGAGGES
ncbi:MAG: substrate-binding domain-containing protein [Myxococcales bacterium]